MHTREEVYKATLEYFNGDDLATNVWIDKYALKTGDQYSELTPDDMHWRIAKEFARIEKKFKNPLTEEQIYEALKEFKYVIPQGSVMSVLGDSNFIGSLSNCTVIDSPKDSYGGIFYTDQQAAQLMKRRCGVGFDISTLRPNKSTVKNSAKTSTGSVSFMERFSNTTREVAQDGRRGALMLTIDVKHIDIEDFIDSKNNKNKITGANISVRISDEFLQCVKNNTDFTLQFPIDTATPQYTKIIKARNLWDKIIHNAHKTGEPGLLFWDRHHLYSPSSCYPAYINICTNPCSEIAMGKYDSCRLICLNMYEFVNNPFTKKAKFDFDKWNTHVQLSTRLSDDLVELELEYVEKIINKILSDPEPNEIKQVELDLWKKLYDTGKNGRRVGLGITALADTIAALGYKYGSSQCNKIIDEIMSAKFSAEWNCSIDMAIERGTFLDWNNDVENNLFFDFIKTKFPDIYERNKKYGRRNISISTLAPTGSVSILTQTSSGIEPVFMCSYIRRKKVMGDTAFDIIDELGDKWINFEVIHPKIKIWKEINKQDNINESPYSGQTAHDIEWKKRIELQAICQEYISHSISATINLSSSTPKEMIGEIYMYAWEKGLKGITVYRDGCRAGVLVTESKPEKTFKKRPKKLNCEIFRFNNNNEKWIAFIGLDDKSNDPFEIFTGLADDFPVPSFVEKGQIVKTKTEKGSRYDFVYIDRRGEEIVLPKLDWAFSKEFWNYAKLCSGLLRQGMSSVFLIELISTLKLDNSSLNTWQSGVIRALKRFVKDGTKTDKLCVNCGQQTLIYENGCMCCKNCGYSLCS